jgi:dTDP-glucose 4,6-dehydratase
MPRTLITGGAGFLGSHLCDRFIEEGHEVVCMDNLITGDTQNVEHLFDHGEDRFRFVKYDVTDYLHVNGDLDYVLHFASPASPIDYLNLPIQTLKVGALGTHKALGLAKAKDARLLLASTSEVYGDPQVHPQAEDYWGNVNPIGPRGVYDEAKRFAEALTMAYHRYHGVETRIVRIFNTYGPRMRIDDGRALPTFMSQALRGEPLTVYGDGSQTRAFCYVDDLVEGIYRLLMSDVTEPVNIGNPDEVTIKEFAEEIIEITGTDSGITYEDLPKDDPQVRQPDISRAREKLGWAPQVDRRDGLERTLDYFRRHVDPKGTSEGAASEGAASEGPGRDEEAVDVAGS